MTSPSRTDFVTRAGFELAMARIDARLDQFEARMEARFAQTETVIERANVTSIRWVVGMSFGLYALMFGLILFVLSRELPHA
jgi:hypothetical protein